MKKDVPFQLLTLEALALYGSFLTLLLPWSAISKVILLMSFSFVCLSVALRVIRGWPETSNTTSRRGGLNRLARLAEAEKRIALGTKTTTSDYKSFDQWQELNEQDRRNNASKTSIVDGYRPRCIGGLTYWEKVNAKKT